MSKQMTVSEINEAAARAWHREWSSGKYGTYAKTVEAADAAAELVRKSAE
jgi:uncharacterized protein YfaA (DUF2138 family)